MMLFLNFHEILRNYKDSGFGTYWREIVLSIQNFAQVWQFLNALPFCLARLSKLTLSKDNTMTKFDSDKEEPMAL